MATSKAAHVRFICPTSFFFDARLDFGVVCLRHLIPFDFNVSLSFTAFCTHHPTHSTRIFFFPMTSLEYTSPFFRAKFASPGSSKSSCPNRNWEDLFTPWLLAQEELGTGNIRRSQNYRVRFSPYATPSRHKTPPRSTTHRNFVKKAASPFTGAGVIDSGS